MMNFEAQVRTGYEGVRRRPLEKRTLSPCSTVSMDIVDTPSMTSRRFNGAASAAASAPRSITGSAFMYNTTPQTSTILLACKLPGHNNIISCIVNRDSIVESAASHIKAQAKANFDIDLPPVDKIRLSTTTRFGYAIPLGRNETVGCYFPAFDGEVIVTTSGNGNAGSPKKRKRKKSPAPSVPSDAPSKPATLSSKNKKQKKKKPAVATSTTGSGVDPSKQAKTAKRKKTKETDDATAAKGKSGKGKKKEKKGASKDKVTNAQTTTAEDESGAAKKKPRKAKKPKDPNAPKKPTATFIRFRLAMKDKLVDGKKMELSDISAAWKSEAYAAKRKAIEKEFAKDMKKYKAAEATYLKKTQQGEADGSNNKPSATGPKSTKKAKVAPVKATIRAARKASKEAGKPSNSESGSSSSSSSGSDSSSSSSSDSDSSSGSDSDDEPPIKNVISTPPPAKAKAKKKSVKAKSKKGGVSKRKVDPNAPKRPANVFMRFSDYLRREKNMKNDFKNFSVSINRSLLLLLPNANIHVY